MKARNEYFDFLRGIAIIMVIGIHTLPALKDYDSVGSVLIITIRQLLNCAVPLFLAISGFFILGYNNPADYGREKDITAAFRI